MNYAKPIDALTEILQVGGGGGLWTNGLSPSITLPANATNVQIVKDYFEKVRSPQKEHPIIQEKEVTIDGSVYRAVEIKDNQKTLVMMIQRHNDFWWAKVFEIDSMTEAFNFTGLFTKNISEKDPQFISWGPQKDYFKSGNFRVVTWEAAKAILSYWPLQGGKQYHTGWLAIICQNGKKYLSKEPEIDAYLKLAKDRNLKLTGFASE